MVTIFRTTFKPGIGYIAVDRGALIYIKRSKWE
jgi:hypothetical protein